MKEEMEKKKNWPILLVITSAILFSVSLLIWAVIFATCLQITAKMNRLEDQIEIAKLGPNNVYVRFVDKITDRSLLNGKKTVKQGDIIVLDASQAVGVHTVYDSKQGINEKKIFVTNFLAFTIPGRSGLWRACEKGPTAFVVQEDGEINFQLLEYPVTGYLSATKTTEEIAQIGWAKIIYQKRKWLPDNFCQPIAITE